MRILAIGDIHGCSIALNTLLNQINLRPGDIVVTLGDYVNKGPDTKGVLDCLIDLHERRYLVPIRGNHDLMMLLARSLPEALPFLGSETLQSYGISPTDSLAVSAIPESHWHFLAETCLNWWETEHHFFLHATAHPHFPLPQQPYTALFWEKFHAPLPHQSGKVMICGHTSQKSGKPINLGYAICLDTWACGGGWLTCLEVNTGKLWQANQQGNYRIAHLHDFQ